MLGFLIAALAGFLTPRLDGPVAGPIAETLKGYFAIEPAEIRLISFMAALVIAAICAAVLGSGSTFGVIVGAVLGYFGARIYAVLKKIIEARTDDD
jgi:hypothetical protein